ncbi:alpha/beta fold hydrolase [Belnapia rosea]|uniref:alpha/beta fold hydrolase n=1 Tax=Belnapia rosea TaxID=938405 RepID=UPI0015A1B9BB|nr:alpha/beta fold hydrolase [Belnapia rosea]
MVLIPALLSDGAMYREVIEQLGGMVEAQVMVLSEPTIQDNVAAVLAKAPPKFIVVGTSYGSSIALEVGLAAPERVTALWLMGCDPAAPEASVQELVAGLETMPGAVIEMLAKLAVPKEATRAAEIFMAMAGRVGSKAGAVQARALRSRAEVTSRLAALRMPALVVWGEADQIVPVSVGRALADGLPHAHFHVLRGCGHLPTLEAPAECSKLFKAFLENDVGYGR